MKLSTLLLFISTGPVVKSFQVFPSLSVNCRNRPLFLVSKTPQLKSFTAASGMNLEHVQVLIDNLDETNYVRTLEMLEPLLLNEADSELYEDSMKRIFRKAHHLGIPIPDHFGQDNEESRHPPFSTSGDGSLDKTAGSGMHLEHVQLLIDNLTGSNFDVTLDTIEPFLINEADDEMHDMFMKQILVKAKKLGKVIPDNFGEKTLHP